MLMLIHLMLSKRSFNLFSFFKILFFLFILQLGCFPLPCLADCWCILLHPLICWSPLVYFSFYSFYYSTLVLFYTFCLFVEIFTEFFHSCLQSSKHLCGHYFKTLYQAYCLSPFFKSSFSGAVFFFYIGAYSFVSHFAWHLYVLLWFGLNHYFT